MALLLGSFGNREPERVQRLKAELNELARRAEILAQAEKEALDSGDIRKLNRAQALRKRNDFDIQARKGLLAQWKGSK